MGVNETTPMLKQEYGTAMAEPVNERDNQNGGHSGGTASNANRDHDGDRIGLRRKSSYLTRSDSRLHTHGSFLEDARHFREGTVPHSVTMALVIGIVCGVAAWAYYAILEYALAFIWHKLPKMIIIGKWPEWAYVLWIPIVGLTSAIFVGLSVIMLGEPGDLPYTVKAVHDHGYMEIDHALPMVAASQFSLIGGGSLGPEAPLVAVCACLGGFISRKGFRMKRRNIVRKHTLMGMAGALAAFFGCALGGSLFALEINSRLGVEYFEHAMEAILCGTVTLTVFRALAGLPIGPIWQITVDKIPSAEPLEVIYGAAIGLIGAFVAYLFATMHWRVMDGFNYFGLMPNDRAIYRALVGAVVIVGIGMAIPQTMFWGEVEFQTLSTLSPASTLPHIWPTSGLFGFEMNSGLTSLLTGVAKLVAISFTVSGGYRGGYIFPFFATGACLGRAIWFVFPYMPVQITILCVASGLNVAITRTGLATPLILCALAGEQEALAPVLAASLASLMATAYMPFIKSQVARSDVEGSLFFYHDEPHWYEDDEGDLIDGDIVANDLVIDEGNEEESSEASGEENGNLVV